VRELLILRCYTSDKRTQIAELRHELRGSLGNNHEGMDKVHIEGKEDKAQIDGFGFEFGLESGLGLS
jgi:hypothetical protein